MVGAGSDVRHGLDPKRPEVTLCGAVKVDRSTNLYRSPFYGRGPQDCSICARLVLDNHYPIR